VVGRTLSHYRVVERLGAGGMGEVYRAHDLKLDRDVALKVLPQGSLADETARSRFRKEAHALSRLSHPHVATLLDFGLARLLRREPGESTADTATETAAGAIVGSPPYMAPEQLLGKRPDARTDLYAAGAVLYEMATGRRPFGTRNGVALSDAILHELPPPPRSVAPDVSPGLESVILKALDKDPELRYQTARELLVDLERLQAAPPSERALPPLVLAKPHQRRRLVLVAAAASFALAAGAWLLRPLPPLRITNVRPLRLDLGWYGTSGLVSTWTTDGLRLYCVARRDEEYRLLQRALTGGEPSEIEVPVSFRRGFGVYGFLPGLSALLCLVTPERPGGWPVWLVPVPRGAPRRLGDLMANSAAVSADGQQILLVQYLERRLLLAKADGSGARELIGTPGMAQSRRREPEAPAHTGGRAGLPAAVVAGRESDRLRRPAVFWSIGERLCRLGQRRHRRRPRHSRPRTELLGRVLASRRALPRLFSHRLAAPRAAPGRPGHATGRAVARHRTPAVPEVRPRVFALEAPAYEVGRIFLPERATWQKVTVPGVRYANWTRDGESLIGINPREGRLERFSLATRRSEVIADLHGLNLTSVGTVAWMGLDETDTPLVTRDVTTADLYALDFDAP
jgi:hypothetical protein